MMDRRSNKLKAILLIILLLFVGKFSCKKADRIEPKSKSNSPPVITSVSIIPEKPIRDNDLNLNVQSQDPDQDPVTYHFQWIKNDQEMIGENGNVLRGGNFKKGDLIRVRVT